MYNFAEYREVLIHVQRELKHNYIDTSAYKDEFDKLKEESDVLNTVLTRDTAWLPFNRCKNRYKDILPYDCSRVPLSHLPGAEGSDYINASFIKGPPGFGSYIATQGPLKHTVQDFWRLVWEMDVTAVVMICKEFELGRAKCANYWGSSLNETQSWGPLSVTWCTEKANPDYILRQLKLLNNGAERTVYQYQYLTWPDRDVPSDSDPLSAMLNLMREQCPEKEGGLPVLVHCSAGCGRTGTVVSTDYIWTLIKQGGLTKEFSLYEMVLAMRKQRVAICQTKQQYGFVYYSAIQLLENAVAALDQRMEASSDTLYENIPISAKTSVDYCMMFGIMSWENRPSQPQARGDMTRYRAVTSLNFLCKPPTPPPRRSSRSSMKSEEDVRLVDIEVFKPDTTFKPEPASIYTKPDESESPFYRNLDQTSHLPTSQTSHYTTLNERPQRPTSLPPKPKLRLSVSDHSPSPAGTPEEPLYAIVDKGHSRHSLTPDPSDDSPPPLPPPLPELPRTGHVYEDVECHPVGPFKPNSTYEDLILHQHPPSPGRPHSQHPPSPGRPHSQLPPEPPSPRQESTYEEISEDTFSDVTDNALKKPDSSEEEDIYETIGNDSPAELSVTELRTRNDVRGASLNRMSGLTKSKLRGFKGFLSNTKDKLADQAHAQSRRVNSPKVTDHHNSQTSISSAVPDWEFGKRVAKPRGPRPEPTHWIKIK